MCPAENITLEYNEKISYKIMIMLSTLHHENGTVGEDQKYNTETILEHTTIFMNYSDINSHNA